MYESETIYLGQCIYGCYKILCVIRVPRMSNFLNIVENIVIILFKVNLLCYKILEMDIFVYLKVILKHFGHPIYNSLPVFHKLLN